MRNQAEVELIIDPKPRPDEEILGRLRRIRRVQRLMDESFRIPVLGIRLGLDGILGLLPGAGDLITSLVAAWIVMQAREMGAPKHLVARMAANVAIDLLGGSIPALGDIFDIAFKANTRNFRLLLAHFDVRDEDL